MKKKLQLDGILICEGKYDKIKLQSVLDATIFTTEGFSIFKNPDKVQLLKRLGETQKIYILTDSDVAGFQIRTYLNNVLKPAEIVNLCIPDKMGKEKRKATPSKEGKLGVEGMEAELLCKLIQEYSSGWGEKEENREKISKNDLYFAGLLGGENSSVKRKEFLMELQLPEHMSTNLLISTLNKMMTKNLFENTLKKLNKLPDSSKDTK